MKKLLFVASVVFVLVFIGCDDNNDTYHQVKYTITGTVSTASASYITNEGLKTEVVNVPFQYEFSNIPGTQVHISAKKLAVDGTITVAIYIDGVLATSETSDEDHATVNASAILGHISE